MTKAFVSNWLCKPTGYPVKRDVREKRAIKDSTLSGLDLMFPP